jgi:hypothetical protein
MYYMNVMKKGLWHGFIETLILGLLVAMPAAAQPQKPLIELSTFSAEGLALEESRLIGNLVRSYLSDFGDVVGNFDATLQSSLAPSIGRGRGRLPDYVVTGSIILQQDKFKFTLDINNTATGETSTINLDIRSMNELVTKTRSLVKDAFPAEADAGPPEEAKRSRVSQELVIGTWKGEREVQRVRLYESHQGVAFLSSGVRMNLDWEISENTLRIWQTSPNTERFYSGDLSAELMVIFVDQAKPLRWELALYGNVLRGDRIFTAVGNGEGEPLLFGQRETVEWTRTAR